MLKIKRSIRLLLLSAILPVVSYADEYVPAFSKSWDLGGCLTVDFHSDVAFAYTQDDEMQLSAHLPGLHTGEPEEKHFHLEIDHHHQLGNFQLQQKGDRLDIVSMWEQKLPPDFIHLLYGAARVAWLENNIFPVHAACIGNDDGYVLLMGTPGSGKTSLTLNAAYEHGYRVFSGDKTLLKFDEQNQLVAIAGTRTITVRMEDVDRWSSYSKENEHLFGDRMAFQLPPAYYSEEKAVPIKKIIFVGLNDNVEVIQQLTPISALHMLYPFFMDKQREDILVEGNQAFFDGMVSREIRAGLAKNLKVSLEEIPVYKAVASQKKITALINGNAAEEIAHKKILMGICGISNGHCSRQLPIILHLLEQGHEVLIFTYGDGLSYFKGRLPENATYRIIPVANPYYVGTPKGLDFELTAQSDKNAVDFTHINALAMHLATTEFGRPDLVISDYEMVAAQYAYVKNVPLITLDQQSKYLVGDFSPLLNGTSYIDEVERLGLFFPKAEKRIAVSFFRVKGTNKRLGFDVEVLPPMIRPEVLEAKGFPRSEQPSILVYVTAQQLGEQPIDEWIETIRSALPQGYRSHLFLARHIDLPKDDHQLSFYHHGDKRFDPVLFSSHGIITTAGHNLLSEAMYLEKPVFALPLPLYEQQLNAHIIDEGGFGLSRPDLTVGDLSLFFANLEVYTKNIIEDKTFLHKEPGNVLIIDKVDALLKR